MLLKKAWKVLGVALSVLGILSAAPAAEAKTKNEPEKILYIPHDNRPIVYDQTIAVVEKAGYKVIVPPREILGSRDDLGNPDRLWEWLDRNAKSDVRAAVISSDALLYGSLVSSRKHNYDKQIILARTELFKDFRKRHKKLPVYVFGSVMRTPRNGVASGYGEPDYYRNYGANIFRYTALIDKHGAEGLTPRETKEINFLQKLIPARALDDWMSRREKNFEASERLVDMAKDKTFDCLLLGRDDNAPYSQTHMEGRNLAKYGAAIPASNYQTIAGIDEIGLMLLARAINDRTNSTPTVFVTYNTGVGGETVPSYSDEPLDDSINAEFLATGARRTEDINRADFVLAVNTNPDGRTFEAPDPINTPNARAGTRVFANGVQNLLDSGKNVAVADVAFANGSDNALMTRLRDNGALFKLHAYAGWNTATNSTGFALGEGILARNMTGRDRRELLLARYLDDWAYQANVRGAVANQLNWLEGEGYYELLDEKRYDAADWCAQLLTNFVQKNLPEVGLTRNLRVEFPWNRMFEARITFQ